jgi:hypothetical protein
VLRCTCTGLSMLKSYGLRNRTPMMLFFNLIILERLFIYFVHELTQIFTNYLIRDQFVKIRGQNYIFFGPDDSFFLPNTLQS